MEVLMAIAVFCVAGALDFAYARWFDSIKKAWRWKAASWAVVVGGIGFILGYCVYNLSSWYAIPELAGFFVGTALAVGEKNG